MSKKLPLYYVSIEPTYSQGVGDYHMFTDNIDVIQQLRNKLFGYKMQLETEETQEEGCY
jgi:hypothetical protein